MSGCKQTVWHRDTYRRTGRGPTGFQLHYKSAQCTREAAKDGLCWQHQIDRKETVREKKRQARIDKFNEKYRAAMPGIYEKEQSNVDSTE